MSWMIYACYEGVMKAVLYTSNKFIGLEHPSLWQLAFVIFGMECIRAAVAALTLKKRGEQFLLPAVELGLCALLGLNLVLMSLALLKAFALDAPVSTVSLLVLSSLFFSALSGRIFLDEHLNVWHAVALIPFVIAAYCFDGAPPLERLIAGEVWRWLILVEALLITANETLTSYIMRRNSRRPAAERINELPLKSVLAMGFFAAVLLGVGLLLTGNESNLRTMPPLLWVLTGVNGLLVFLGMMYRLLAYQDAAMIVPKKMVSRLTELGLTVFAGLLLFGESHLLLRLTGIAFALVSIYTLIVAERKRG